MFSPFRHAKETVERMFGCRIYRNSLPHGTDFFFDIDRRWGLNNLKVVFDVGANIGQSAELYARQFPNAEIYSFEPVQATYQKLASAANGLPRVHAFPLGMGREAGQATIFIHPCDHMSSLADRPNSHDAGTQTSTITIDTLTNFVQSKGINAIDFLKVDTEGYDLEVLKGAESLLNEQRIRVILTECEPVARTGNQVAFPDTAAFMRDHGYELLGVYEQTPEWYGQHVLLFWNAMFVCADLVNGDKDFFVRNG